MPASSDSTTLTPHSDFAAALRGDLHAWNRLADAPVEKVLIAAERHGVVPLLAMAARDASCGVALGRALRARARQEAAIDAVRERDLRDAMRALAVAGLPAVLIKGTALAYSCYERADLRVRMDTDVLVELDRLAGVDAVLRGCGYHPVEQIQADLVMYQTAYVKQHDKAVTHVIDVHWRVMNPQRFGKVLSFADVHAESVPLPRLDVHARAASPVHAMLLACVHRVAHHRNSDRLIWKYDISLLGRQLSGSSWDRLADLAIARGVGTVCLASLDATSAAFPVDVPGSVRRRFEQVRPDEGAAAAYAQEGRPHAANVLDDVRALPNWKDRWQLIRQHLLPPATYMRQVYARDSAAPLGVLYLRRVWRGARKWLVRGGS